MTKDDISLEILARLGMVVANSFISSTMLTNWENQAMRWACAYKSWPFLETKDETELTVADQEEYDYPTSLKSDSTKFLKIGSEVYEKIRLEDYLAFRTNKSNDEDKVFADYNRKILINPKAFDAGSSIIIYGQGKPTDMSADSSTSPFSTAEPEGDEAIIKYALSLAYTKKGDKAGARQEKVEAMEILDNIWEKIKDAQPSYMSKDKQLFKDIDILNGGGIEDYNPNRFY